MFAQNASRAWFQEKLDDPIFCHWLRLNYSPAHWVDPSWLGDTMANLHPHLLNQPSAQIWLQEQLTLPKLSLAFFDLPLSRLLFAPTAALQHLLSALGAMCYGLRMDLIIDKHQRQALRQQLPESTLQYIENTGPLLLSRRPTLLDDLRQSRPLINPSNQQVIHLSTVGECILYQALAYHIKQNGRRHSNDELNAWGYILQRKRPRRAEDKEGLLDAVNAPADKLVATLIAKLTLHLEPACKTLLR